MPTVAVGLARPRRTALLYDRPRGAHPGSRSPSEGGRERAPARVGGRGARPEAHAVRDPARRNGARAGGAGEGRPAERAQPAGLGAERGVRGHAHRHGGRRRAREARGPGAAPADPGGGLRRGARAAGHGGVGARQAHRLALPRPAPARPAAGVRGADHGGARDARALAGRGFHRAAHPEVHGFRERVRGGAVQGGVL